MGYILPKMFTYYAFFNISIQLEKEKKNCEHRYLEGNHFCFVGNELKLAVNICVNICEHFVFTSSLKYVHNVICEMFTYMYGVNANINAVTFPTSVNIMFIALQSNMRDYVYVTLVFVYGNFEMQYCVHADGAVQGVHIPFSTNVNIL